MKHLWIILLLMLTACDCDETCQASRAADEKINDQVYCTPKLVTTADDGTKLFSVSARCHKNPSQYPVFFSEKGAQSSHEEEAGTPKTRRYYEVPDNYVPSIKP